MCILNSLTSWKCSCGSTTWVANDNMQRKNNWQRLVGRRFRWPAWSTARRVRGVVFQFACQSRVTIALLPDDAPNVTWETGTKKNGHCAEYRDSRKSSMRLCVWFRKWRGSLLSAVVVTWLLTKHIIRLSFDGWEGGCLGGRRGVSREGHLNNDAGCRLSAFFEYVLFSKIHSYGLVTFCWWLSLFALWRLFPTPFFR